MGRKELRRFPHIPHTSHTPHTPHTQNLWVMDSLPRGGFAPSPWQGEGWGGVNNLRSNSNRGARGDSLEPTSYKTDFSENLLEAIWQQLETGLYPRLLQEVGDMSSIFKGL